MRVMPFGKHKGEPLSEVPDDYLEWCLEKMERLSDYCRHAFEEEMDRRYPPAPPPPKSPPPRRHGPVSRETARAIIAAGRRSLAASFHPDRGGSHERMVEINHCADFLELSIERLLER